MVRQRGKTYRLETGRKKKNKKKEEASQSALNLRTEAIGVGMKAIFEKNTEIKKGKKRGTRRAVGEGGLGGAGLVT